MTPIICKPMAFMPTLRVPCSH